jgi:excisionase family DNA binding protein
MGTVATVPTLDDLAREPVRARDLPASLAMDFLVRLAGLQPILLARCVAVPVGTEVNERNGQEAATITHEPDDVPLLTAADAAKVLTLEEWRIYELARQGKLPVVRIGRNVRFKKSDLLAWIEQRREK